MQIILYEVNKSILTVGFKENNFIVYSSIYNSVTKTRKQLLQQAYEQVKKAIDYEKTLEEHSLTTDGIGEVFTPEEPKVNTITLSLSNNHIQFEENQEEVAIELSSIIKDQYDEIIESEVTYTSSKGDVSSNILTISKVEEYAEAEITANIGDIRDNNVIYLYPYVAPSPYEPSVEEIKIQELEQQLLDVQAYIVNKQYEELLSEGGL